MLAKGHRRKQQIVDMAKDMFIKYGFQSTHIGKICEKLDIARGTVYQYFGNKREILFAILESLEESIEDILDSDDLNDYLKTNPLPKTLIGYIIQRIASAINEIISEPITLKLIFKEIIGIDEHVISRINSFIDYVVKAIVRDINEIVKTGLCRKDINSEDTARLVMGGILFMVNNNKAKNKAKIEKKDLEVIIENYIQGLLK